MIHSYQLKMNRIKNLKNYIKHLLIQVFFQMRGNYNKNICPRFKRICFKDLAFVETLTEELL